MLQFYLLSIFANILGGMALSSGYLDQHLAATSGIKQFFESKPGLRVSLGVAAIIAGVLKLLSVTSGDVPVVGDLIPSLTGMIVGLALIFERYKEKTTIPLESQAGAFEVVDRVVSKNRTLIGIGAIVVGLLHFLIPGVLFL